MGILNILLGGAPNWTQLGKDIKGKEPGDRAGRSVVLSDDGTIVAVGAPENDGSGEDAGHARVFAWNARGATWTQLGQEIQGEAPGDQAGQTVALSSDGTIVAVGAIGNSGSAGQVRILAWDAGSAIWTRRGADIEGEEGDRLASMALSRDGTTFAVGATGNSGSAGQVRVVTWDARTKRGADIKGEAAGDRAGRALLMFQSWIECSPMF